MNAKTLRATCIATLLCATNLVSVAAAAPAVDPAKRVGPFLDDQVVAVFRVDATRVDAKALESWLAERMNTQADKSGGAGAERIRAAAQDLARPRGELEKALGGFKAAGGRELYGLLRMDDLMRQQSPVLVVPVEAGADAKKLESLFGQEGGAPGDKFTEVVGDVLLVGADAQRAPAREAKANNAKAPAAANADLAAALASLSAAADAPAIQLAIAPSAESRTAFEQLAPNLPPQLGGGQTSDITRGLRWSTVAIALPPKPSVRVTIQARDAAALESLDKTIRAAVDAGVKAMQAEAAKHHDAAQTGMFRAAVKILPSLIPAREGNSDRLVLAMDDAKLSELTGVISNGLVMARGNAQRVRSMSHIRQLLLACVLWANDHKGAFPDDLAAAAKAYDAEAVLRNPRGGKSDYKYVKPPLGNQSPAERIVIYETDALDPNGLDVGFADGHVEFMSKEQFDKQFKAQEEKDKAAPAAK